MKVYDSDKGPDYFNGNIDLKEKFFIKIYIYLPYINSVKRSVDVVRGLRVERN